MPAQAQPREIPDEIDNCSMSTPLSDLTEGSIRKLAFNFGNGKSQEVMMDLITHGYRNAGIQKELQKRKEEISGSQDRRIAFDKDKRLTAGTIWKSNGCCLNEDVLHEHRRRDDKLFQQNMDSMAKTAEKHQRRLRAYEALVREGDHNKETVQVLKL